MATIMLCSDVLSCSHCLRPAFAAAPWVTATASGAVPGKRAGAPAAIQPPAAVSDNTDDSDVHDGGSSSSGAGSQGKRRPSTSTSSSSGKISNGASWAVFAQPPLSSRTSSTSSKVDVEEEGDDDGSGDGVHWSDVSSAPPLPSNAPPAPPTQNGTCVLQLKTIRERVCKVIHDMCYLFNVCMSGRRRVRICVWKGVCTFHLCQRVGVYECV